MNSFMPGTNRNYGRSPLLAPASLPVLTLKKTVERNILAQEPTLPKEYFLHQYAPISSPPNAPTICIQGKSLSIDEIVEDVVQHRDPLPPSGNKEIVSNVCPLSCIPITCPSRGINCSHQQCFDLRGFLLLCCDTSEWKCPICQNIINFEELRFDPFFLCGNFSVDSVTLVAE